ncbi:glycosyltransferase family 2 protein [Lyngbya sp. CCY1209]|jgi:glycosyltransferase involved in cell wall biosynthesis|uniref:glycosyltransferase family 2 protein n=1 Tax=Lyngbya sp. CCY1209 TaxID=2886103 RepID=UPI002D205209|nr:glycosyltransferase family 2 protein [Lyngbya sp. CCY1209]MEB3886239.1 glycosyltransferase [Lyngbya sp. CCY1209]
MNNQPKVSIGLPVYNGEAFLETAIEAVLNQTFGDFELIICDNASDDRTAEICQKYQELDGRIRYYRNSKNIGAAPNFNRTFELSRGEYFKWMASDDIIEPTFIELCLEALEKNKSAVVACPMVDFTKADGSHWWTPKPVLGLDAETPAQRFKVALSNFWCTEIFGLMRSDAIAQTSQHVSYYGSDKLLLAELSLLGSFETVNEFLFKRRCHSNQSSRLSKEERDTWIDSENSKRSKLLRPRHSTESLKAIFKIPLNWRDRSECLQVFVGHFLGSLGSKISYHLGSRMPKRFDRNLAATVSQDVETNTVVEFTEPQKVAN